MWKFQIATSLCCWRVIPSCQHLLCKSSREEKRGSGFEGLVYRTLTVHLLFFLAALKDLSDLVQIWLIWKQDHHCMWYVLFVVSQRGEHTISYRSRSRMSTVYMYHNEQQWTSCNLSSQQHHFSQRSECVMWYLNTSNIVCVLWGLLSPTKKSLKSHQTHFLVRGRVWAQDEVDCVGWKVWCSA